MTTQTKPAITSLSAVATDPRSGTTVPFQAFPYPLLIFLLAAGLLAATTLAASLGAIHVPIPDMLAALTGRHPLTEIQHTILFAIRIPRVLASALVGAALSVSGLMFQGLFRNPMAEPYVIGASGGAAVGASVGLLFFAEFTLGGFSAAALLAFLGAVLTMTVVYILARSRGRTNGVTLLLAGFAIGTMLTNSTYAFEFKNKEVKDTIESWLHGVVGTPEWRQLAVSSALFFFAALAAYPLMRRLNTLALGDDYAQQLGVRVEWTRAGIILIGSLLAAIAVALGGLISFAGLIVPHVARLLIGPDNVRLLPVTALAGAIFLVLADTLARLVLAPTELPVGLIMVFLGGPFFLYLLRKHKRDYSL